MSAILRVISAAILLTATLSEGAAESQRLTVSPSHGVSQRLTSVSHLPQNTDDDEAGALFSIEAFRDKLATTALHRIEGIWRLTSGGAEIGILRKKNHNAGQQDMTEYEIVILGAADRALRAGTVIGTLRPTAKASTYQARIYTRQIGSKLCDPHTFILRLDSDENRIIFERKKSNLSVNLWRLLPYLWRVPLERRREPAATEGAIRIYPQPEIPLEPRYL